MKNLSFSQPYFISHTAIAKKKESQFLNIAKNLWSWKFLSAILILVGIIFIFGLLVWIFERQKNKAEFGGKYNGIWESFWWSAVTMTTVGYGDKAPKTAGGRVVGFIWMFLAIIMFSSLTASIASSLTVETINENIQGVEDLNRFTIATVESSSSEELLEFYQIENIKVVNESEGIDLVLNGKTTFFVYDQPILNYEINRRNLGSKLEIASRTLKRDYYSYTFPKGSKLLRKIDPVLISTLNTMEWDTIIDEYK